MKGPQGTLVSGRANSADKALLLAELLKRAGATVQLVRGTLPVERQPKVGLPEELSKPPTDVQVNDFGKRLGIDGAALRTALNTAQVKHEKLLENLWTRTDRDIGAVAGALAAARVNVPTAVTWQAPVEHWWVRTDQGDLDPTLGQPGGTEAATCAIDDIPADRFHTVAIRVRVGQGGRETAFLDRSFRSADLFGQTVAVANAPVGFAKTLESGGKLTAQAIFDAAGAVTEFQPQLFVAGKTVKGDAFDLNGNKVAPKGGRADKAKDLGGGMGGLFGGLSGGEGEAEKPAKATAGKVTLTTAYLEVELTAPGAAQPVRIRRDLLLPGSEGRQRVLDLLAVREILVMPDEVTPDFVNNAVLEYADAWRKWLGEHDAADYNPLKVSEYQSQPYFDPTLYGFGMLRRNQLRRLSETRLGGAQWVHPRPMVVSYVRRLVDARRPTMVAGIDILENTVLPLDAAPGDWRRQFAFAAGILDTALEHEVNAGPGAHSNTSVYLEQALLKGQQPVAVQGSLPRDARLSAVARAQIQQQLRGAAVVLVPQDVASWYRVDLATGTTLGYVEGGGGQEMAEYAELIAMDIEMYGIMKFWGDLFRCIAMGVQAPLAGMNGLESLEECFKLMCGSVSGVVGKLTGWEGLISALVGMGVDAIYGELCQKLWNTMTGKGGKLGACVRSPRPVGQRWLVSAGVLAAAMLAAAMLLSAHGVGGITLLLSADTEGQTRPCQTCSIQTAPGGMARRATLVGERRRRDPSLLLVDAGNAFLGADSVASGGDVIVAAYNALNYDAVNLSYRDFRLGKAQTLKMIRDARFGVVSCNLLDDVTGQLVVRPYVVRQAGAERVAIVGVTERPEARDVLPHLQQQLAGIRVQPPIEALSAWLPKARRESARVVLLFYGSAVGLDAVRQKFGGDLAAILVGGMPSEVLPRDSRPPLVGAAEHGRRLAELRLSADGRADVRQVEVDPFLRSDPGMESILNAYGKLR